MIKKHCFRTTIYSLCIVAIALLVGSCGESPSGTGKSPIYLTTENGSDLWGLDFDVYDSSLPGGVGRETFEIKIVSNYKNPTETLASPSYADVTIQEYHVSYYRPDGKLPVPASFMVQLTSKIPAGGENVINAIVLRRDAKLRSPLKELVLGGGGGYLDLVAVIDFYGEDLMGINHHARYVLPMFASDM